MSKANVNIEDVASFQNSVQSETEAMNDINSRFSEQLSEIDEQIKAEKKKLNTVLDTCQKGINRLTVKIDELKEELEELEAKLAVTPPVIVTTVTDSDGNSTTVEEPNPEYEAIESQIAVVEEKLSQLENFLAVFEQLQMKATHQIALLEQVVTQLQALREEIGSSLHQLEGCSGEAVFKLRNIQQALQEYVDTKIDAPDIGKSSENVEGIFGYRKGKTNSPIKSNDELKKCTPQLRKTKQHFENDYNINGKKCKVFDHPKDTCKKIAHSQGNNTLGYGGTCGLVTIMNNLRKAGVDINEDAIVKYARDHNLCAPGGGTIPEVRKILLEQLGIPCSVSRHPDSDEMAKHIEAGKAVLATVNAGVFWDLDNPEHDDYSMAYGSRAVNCKYRSNHVIMPYSTCRDDNGTLLGFIVCDSGRNLERDGSRFMSVDDFEKAIYNVNGTTICYSNKAIW